jgi:hypothetical protein
MKLLTQEPSRLPVDDYSAALRNAVAWLGERYLLAVHVTRSEQAAAPRYCIRLSWFDQKLNIWRLPCWTAFHSTNSAPSSR